MQAYFSFLTQLRQALDALAALEQKKIQAVQAGDLAALDECMKKEQVATLDLRGRERKRAELLRRLGLEQVPLRELPNHCPPEYKGQALGSASRCCAAIRCSPAPRRPPAP